MKTRFFLAAVAATIAMASPAHAVTAVKLEITNTNSNWLQVTEIEAFDASLTNVALGKSVTVGGTQALWPGAAPANSVTDGVINGNFSSGALYHPLTLVASQSLTIAFGALKDITKIIVYGRTDGGFGSRDVYSYRFLDSSNGVLSSGSVGATSSGFASISLPSAVPEPSTWALMIAGFAIVGASLRRRRTADAGRLALA